MSLSEAAGSGDTLETLRALRDDLAARMEGCTSDQNFAVLGRLLSDTLAKIEDMGGATSAPRPQTSLTKFEERLREREAAAKGARRTAR